MLRAGPLRVLFCALFALLALPRVAQAHDPFEVTTDAKLHPALLELEVTMTRETAARLGPAGDELGPNLYEVSAAGRVLPTRATRVVLTDDEVTFHVAYDKPELGPLRFAATHLVRLGEGYTSALAFSRLDPVASRAFRVLTAAENTVDFELGEGSRPATATSGFGSFFALGIEHVLEGYDHLLFLAGLLITSLTLRSAVRLITAFTLSHSLTLVLAALGWIAVPAALVESVIAASIIVVGVENFWLRREPRHRVGLVFAFGLVHGLGFASALQGAGLGGSTAPLVGSVVAFNLGVEAAQVALALVTLPVLWKLRGGRFGERAMVATSLLVSLVGAYFFLDRSLLA